MAGEWPKATTPPLSGHRLQGDCQKCSLSLSGGLSAPYNKNTKGTYLLQIRRHRVMSSASVGGGIRIHRVLVRAFELIAYYLLRSCNAILIPLGRLEVMKLMMWMKNFEIDQIKKGRERNKKALPIEIR